MEEIKKKMEEMKQTLANKENESAEKIKEQLNQLQQQSLKLFEVKILFFNSMKCFFLWFFRLIKLLSATFCLEGLFGIPTHNSRDFHSLLRGSHEILSQCFEWSCFW